MTFGEKLFQYRKERGISQEALAEKLNTSRQAISKWENNQGYPETEKLLMLSNIFGVSVDALLKENTEIGSSNEKGYYVSREHAEGFLSYERKVTIRVALSIAIIILAGVPYFLLAENTVWSMTLASLIVVIGIAMLVSVGFYG